MSAFLLQLLGSLLPLVVFASAACLCANQTACNFCQPVDSIFPGRVSCTGSSAYASSQSNYYTVLERELEPSCVFRLTGTSDVSNLVKLVAASNSTSKPDFASWCDTAFSLVRQILAGVSPSTHARWTRLN